MVTTSTLVGDVYTKRCLFALLKQASTSFCLLVLLVIASAMSARAQLVSVEDVQYTPVNTPVQYRWYSSNSGYQYWYISGGQGTVDANSANTNSYQATVTWTATGPAQITYVTSSGKYSLSLNVVACRPIPGATATNYLDAGSFDACSQTKTFTANTATDCYLDDYYYSSSSNTGNPRAQPSADVYYRFHLARPSQVTINSCGSNFDTYLHLLSVATGQVWDDDDSGNATAVGCGGNTSYLSSVRVAANSSTLDPALPATLPPGDYYIIAEGWSTKTGNLQLALTVAPQFTPSVTITTTPAALAVTNNAVEIVRGNSATLTAVGDGVTDFTWQLARTGALVGSGSSISVSPTETTVYQVTGKGCSNSLTATAQVTVQVALGNLNYITTRIAQKAGKTALLDMIGQAPAEVASSTTYYDGLGRPSQKVARAATVTNQDLVQPITYDPLGRSATTYLLYPQDVDNGSFKSNAISQQATFYQPTSTLSRTAQDTNPVAATKYEISPLSRVVEQGAPGATWQLGTSHSSRFNQRATTSADAVRQWNYSSDSKTYASPGTYAPGQLWAKETWNEQGQLVTEYVDKQGKMLLKKVSLAATASAAADLQTYYVYDDLDNLRLVISPEGVNTLGTSGPWTLNTTDPFIRNWCFQYDYDGHHRLISKQVPGTDPVQLVYNRRNQVVLTQDGNQLQAGQGEWSFTKYDGLGRPIMTGVVNLSGDWAAQQANLDTQTVFAEAVDNSNLGYTLNQAFPQSISESNLLTINYYDRYTAKYYDSSSATYTSLNSGQLACTLAADQWLASPLGQATGNSVRIMGTNGTPGAWLTTVTYYDKNYRVVQSLAQNHLGGTNGQLMAYTFVGKPTSATTTITTGTSNAPGYKDVKDYTYFDNGLPLATYQNTFTSNTAATGQGRILLVQNDYNELGQLIAKRLHNTDGSGMFLQKVDYRYNIRGWLTHINNRYLDNTKLEQSPGVTVTDNSDSGVAQPDLFGMELRYDNLVQGTGPSAQAQFNGNIAQAMWQTRSASKPQNNLLRAYNYQYDQANRITAAQYTTYIPTSPSTGVWDPTNQPVDFSVSNIGYDANGNIQSMNRMGTTNNSDSSPQKGLLDQLTYSYQKMVGGQLVKSNQLQGVDDGAAANTSVHDFEDNGSKYNPSTSTPEYEYDKNGNLTRDQNKTLSGITYNRLNQPTLLNITWNRIEYTYSATGTKLQKRTYTYGNLVKTTDYVGPVVYETPAGSTITPVFAQTPEGRVLYLPSPPPAGNSPIVWKYEYHLKDHLGNLRFAFRADVDNNGAVTQLKAGMEPVNAAQEERQFTHVAETRLADPNNARTGSYVARLNAHTGRSQGPSIRLKVAAGDSIRAEVYARYDRGANAGTFLRKGALLVGGTTISVPGQTGTDQTQPIQARGRWLPFLGASLAIVPQLLKAKREALPTAYLRYELFNKDSQLVATKIQALRRTATDEWQHLQVGNKADSAGFVHISLINESSVPAYFDDMALGKVAPTPYQENHYDPWGLDLVGIETEGSPDSKYRFNQGTELNTAFNLNWYETDNRSLDPQIGRFMQADPLADMSLNYSPYVFANNNPISLTDRSGLAAEDGDGLNPVPVLKARLSEVVVTGTRQVKQEAQSLYHWFTGADVNYQGSGWGHGPRRYVAGLLGVNGQANNLIELGANSMLQSDRMQLKGGLLQRVKQDPALARFQQQIVNSIKTDPRFRNLKFSKKGRDQVEFGGKRGSGDFEDMSLNNPVLKKETWDVAENPLTWATRHADVSYTATVKADGTIVISYQLHDTLDLSAQNGRSPAYNAISETTGFGYHTLLGGNKDISVDASWQTTITK